MANRFINKLRSAPNDRRDVYEDTEKVIGPSKAGTWFISPPGVTTVHVDLFVPPGSTARMETTGELENRITNNIAKGLPWPSGDVTERTQKVAKDYTAIRVFVVTGEATVFLKGT